MAHVVGPNPLDSELLIAAINEFYTTTDEQRRHEIDTILIRFKTEYECVQTVGACMRIISQPTSSSSVRYFGTVALYDVIRIRSEECIANQTLQLSLKTFLIDSLTSGAYAQTTSILNKLSASLALFALYCVPDLWLTPVEDLTSLLAGTPEILLKVLSDMAAEFSHVSMPLTQRSKLKGELHKFSENIIQVLAVVLRGGDTSSITKQSAVECVEQWLRLPGMALDQWTQVLSDVLGAVVQDCTALASILDIIAENDEFHRYSTLIINICQYICVHVSSKIEEELKDDATSEEIATLVASTCSVAEKSVSTLVECAVQGGDSELITRLSQVMQVLANMQGQYPKEEIVSDIPSVYFISLRTEIVQTMNSTRVDEQFIAKIGQIYAQMLDVAINKLTFPRINLWLTWNLEEREQFESYRKTRSEVSYDSYNFSAAETLNYLNQKLEEALSSGDINTSEACLFQWECVADYLAETDYPSILKCLEMCAAPGLSVSSTVLSSGALDCDFDRRGATLMRLLYALSHLIQEHDRANELECALIPVILTYVSPEVRSVRQSIDTLQKFVEDRPDSLEVVGDQISTTCYDFFNSPNVRDTDRLAALKCIGYVLSRKHPTETMKIIGQILSHQNIDEPGIDNQTRHRRYAFQINTFSALFSSLTNKKGTPTATNPGTTDEEPTIVQLLREAIPVFEALCSGGSGLDGNNSGNLIQEVCKAVRSALTSLPEQYLPLFFPFVVSLLNSALFLPESAVAACALAKSTVLQCGSLVGVDMANAFAQWVQLFEQQTGSTQIDEYLQLIYQVVRKNWKMIMKFPEPSMAAFRSAIKICSCIIVSSSVPTEVRSASQILAALSTYAISNNDTAMKTTFAEEGPMLIRAVFGRIQGELMRATVEALADILFFYFKEFTTETRALISTEPYGSSALITSMFREIGNPRNFKQQTIRFNLAAVRDPGSVAS
ncbi:hypothetical protein GCK72_009585 [Caenorhabditis remanei]|uniref:Exportin-T n=1 Tax=Caenorhabditis remanei TaxID=31234 RepID=A0A6A5H2X2_CAERE|nr:hypothetical protein GCK72_009585 [Caenorhabditis remanei]KAF1761329.1 hypothetical protein GCK72_009585 [Caenorhabditis remanei]